MPVMGGMEATGLIREFEASENVSRTPIIALTAHAMIGQTKSCLIGGSLLICDFKQVTRSVV